MNSQTSDGPANLPRHAILLAVTGLSPAIVTETVWALAAEKPRVVPRKVIIITTALGAVRLQEQLLTPFPAFGGQTVWESLRAALHASPDELILEPPRLIGKPNAQTGTLDPLQDIVSREDNDLAAGFILEQVRSVVENPETRLIASIAGGRKTMGALLHAAITLIGRETDRLTHILVNAPYETMPGFFFQGQPGGSLQGRGGESHSPEKAVISLADVPFVPMRNRFEDLSEMPGSFPGIVAEFSRAMKQDAERPVFIEICYWKRQLWVDGTAIRIRSNALVLLHFLLTNAEKVATLAKQEYLIEPLNTWLKKAPKIPAGLHPGQISLGDVTRLLSALRVKLRQKGSFWRIPSRMPLRFQPFRFGIREKA